MGVRKRKAAEARKEKSKTTYSAMLRNCPTSPRKMRLVVDLVRGKSVDSALSILKFTRKDAAIRVEKLLLAAISGWQAKNETGRVEDAGLYVKEVMVDSARQLKRLKPAPQGRGYRIRKRSNHVTLLLGQKQAVEATEAKTKAE
jgi:large subunit ribosomal protein L22